MRWFPLSTIAPKGKQTLFSRQCTEMYIFFMPLLFLPLFEIIGFIVIGAHIGFILSLVWLCGSTMLGFYLLRTAGSGALRRARDQGDAVFQLQDAFDSLCLIIAAVLLIFPGFISDFIAIPFLLAPFRHWLFGRAQTNPDSFMRKGYRSWTTTGPDGETKTQTIIEGEFRHVDDKPQLPET